MYEDQKEQHRLQCLVDLFRLIVTKDPRAVSEITFILKKDPLLLARELSFLRGSIFDFADTGCACVLDHENFRYVSESKLDIDALDNILKSVLKGKCPHHDRLPEEDEETVGPEPTSVTLTHAAAVVGYIPVLKILLQLQTQNAPLTYSSKASPLHLAILFNQRLSIKTIIDFKNKSLETYCRNFSYKRQDVKFPNATECLYISIIELCLIMEDVVSAEAIIRSTSTQQKWVIDAISSESDEAFNIISPHVDAAFIDTLDEEKASDVLHHAVRRGETELATMLIKKLTHKSNKNTTLLLAVVYNQPGILKLLTKEIVKENVIKDYTLLDISNILNHTECSDILKAHGVEPSDFKSESPLRIMLDIGKQFRLGKTTDLLIRKTGMQKPLSGNKEERESLIFYSLKHLYGLGFRGLLAICDDIDVKGSDGLTPLGLAMKHDTNPLSFLDVMYFNPVLTQFESNEVKRTGTEKHLSLFDRSETSNISMLALAIERDLKNYSVQKWALCYSGFKIYEGSMAVLLLDCGYDVMKDQLVHFSYLKLLTRHHRSAREGEIRERIRQRIEDDLYHPKILKQRCRDVLRRYFSGHSLHRYVTTVSVPVQIKKYILMEGRLKQRCRGGLVCNIEED